MSVDVLNNVTAPANAPTAASTLDHTPPHSRAIVDVQNAAIMWQAKVGSSYADADWTPVNGAFMAPGSRKAPVDGTVYGFRFWAANAGASPQAQVTVTLP